MLTTSSITGRRLSGALAFVCAFGFVSISAQQAPTSSDLSYRLYRASIAAADASLRLHDTAAARRWLDETPENLRGWEFRYLRARVDESSMGVEAGGGPVNGIDVCRDGTVVVTALNDGAVKLWDTRTGAARTTLTGHTAAVWAAKFSPDGRRLATASSDGTVRVWDVGTDLPQLLMTDVGRGIAAVAWHPQGEQIASSSWQQSPARGVWGVVKLWDASTGRLLREIEHGVKPIVTIAFSPDGRWLAAGTWDADVAVWDTTEWGPPVVLAPPESDAYKAVQGVSFSPDSRLLAVGAKDGSSRVWDVGARVIVATLVGQAEGQRQWVNATAFSPDGALLATASADRTLRLWETREWRQVAVVHGHTGPLTSVVFEREGRRVYTGAGDGTWRAWDLSAIDPDRTTWQIGESVYDLAFSADGHRAAVTGWTGLVAIRDVGTGKSISQWMGHRQSGVRVGWSRDGRWLVTTGNDGRIVLWEAETGREVVVLDEVPDTQITGVAFSPDGAQVAAPTTAGTVKVWDIPLGRLRQTLSDGTRQIWHVAWSPDGRLLAAAGRDGAVTLWDWAAGKEVRRLEHGRGTLVSAFRPDGAMLAIGSTSRTVSLWDVASGRRVRTLEGHDGAVNGLSFAPDGTRLATASDDNTVKIWDPQTGQSLLSVPAATTVYSVTWSPDGTRIAMLPLDGTVVMLDAVPAAKRAR